MPAKNMQVVSNDLSLSFNVKFNPMSTASKSKPTVVAEVDGKEVSLKSVYKGSTVVNKGEITKRWAGEAGIVTKEPTFHIDDIDGEVVEKVNQTKVFEIASFDDLCNYTDEFVIDRYYELFPSDNGLKKDIDKQIAENANLRGMYELWDFLYNNKKVAMGEFNPSSAGFVTSYGYVRAVQFQNKWGLEIGCFKERKVFKHLQEGTPSKVSAPVKQAGKKVSMI